MACAQAHPAWPSNTPNMIPSVCSKRACALRSSIGLFEDNWLLSNPLTTCRPGTFALRLVSSIVISEETCCGESVGVYPWFSGKIRRGGKSSWVAALALPWIPRVLLLVLLLVLADLLALLPPRPTLDFWIALNGSGQIKNLPLPRNLYRRRTSWRRFKAINATVLVIPYITLTVWYQILSTSQCLTRHALSTCCACSGRGHQTRPSQPHSSPGCLPLGWRLPDVLSLRGVWNANYETNIHQYLLWQEHHRLSVLSRKYLDPRFTRRTKILTTLTVVTLTLAWPLLWAVLVPDLIFVSYVHFCWSQICFYQKIMMNCIFFLYINMH